MNTLFTLLVQTKGEAIFAILSLLLVAAIIGYITAWLYYKSIYKRRVKAIESEMGKLNNQFLKLKADNSDLLKTLSEKGNEIENLQKAIQAEALDETDDITLRNKITEKKSHEKDEFLVHIAQRKRLLDYNSFGTAAEAEKDNLRMISGIGPFIEERLHALDIYTFRQISNFTARDIENFNTAIEYFSGRIERDEWVAQARELVHRKDKHTELIKRISERKTDIYYNRIGVAKKEESDDLTIISGIGGWIEEKLNALDIFTFKQISNLSEVDVQKLTEVIEYFPGRIERDEWVLQARELVRLEGKKSELQKRIRERKDKIYYDRLGIAHKHQANNLTLINGIGLWIEERLNLLDIFTFEQISKFTPEDEKTISGILEISPDRIERDNWIGQARKLAKNTKASDNIA